MIKHRDGAAAQDLRQSLFYEQQHQKEKKKCINGAAAYIHPYGKGPMMKPIKPSLMPHLLKLANGPCSFGP